MKLASRSTASKATVLAILFMCMVVSAAEGWFCPDCVPGKARGTASPIFAGCSTSEQLVASDQDTGHASEVTDVCPVCQSPPHVVDSYVPARLAVGDAASQDPPLLSGDFAGFIYKPPRIAS